MFSDTRSRRRVTIAVTTLLSIAAALGATAALDKQAQESYILSPEAVETESGFDAAEPTPARRNRLRRGDADALAAFRTVRPQGALTALAASGDPVKGVFSPVVDWPMVGIHAVLTPDGRVLTYGTTDRGTKSGYFSYDVWDPQIGLGSDSHTVLPNETAVDLFCNVQLLMPSGNIEMWGGDVTDTSTGRSTLIGNDDSNLFNPLDNTLIRTGKMHRKRWYASATTLPNGEVYIQGGTGGADDPLTGGKDYPEVRTAPGKFRLLTGASTLYLNALYPRNFLAPDGQVFGLHYSQMYRVDPSGTGTLTQVGKFSKANIGATSTSVMFAPGKILQVGGGLDAKLASNDAHVVDINPTLPVIIDVADPSYRRHWGNATVLADGRVFLSGGSTADNDAINGVAYTGELYDPASNTWSKAATAKRMRLYHSSALLLPDATVLTVGGGALGPELNLNGEIYYPPYLFKADGTPAARPVIASLPMTTDPGRSVRIGTPVPSSISRVTLVKAGSDTHSVNMDQRFLELPFSIVGGELEARLPANVFLTPPGFYMVFVFDGQGVPSEASMMRINVTGQPSPSMATLTVRNIVVNDDGGAKVATDFSFALNGAAPIPFHSSGTNVLTVEPGTYTVTAPSLAGYSASLAGCSTIALAPDDSATCTITHDDDPAPGGEEPPVPGNLLVNGDFEINNVSGDGRQLVTGLSGWSNKAGPIPVWRNFYTPGRNQSFIEIDGAAGTTRNRIYQNVTTVAGETYELSFLHSPRPGNSAASNRFDVYWNGTRIYRIWIDGIGLTDTSWRRVTLTVTGTGGSDRVSFYENGTDTDDRGALIDDVRLLPQGSGEPEQPPPSNPGTLTVTKVVVNDDGGAGSASDFRFSVNGGTAVAFESDGSNVLSLAAGTYTVTEPAVAGYTATYSGCSNIVLDAGGSATCTITNNDDTAGGAPQNLLVNGDFEAGSTGWGMQTPWSIAGGQATKTSTAGGNVYQEFAFESGATYQVTYTIVSISGGSINTRFINGTGANVPGTNRSAPGTYTQQLVAGDHTRFAINAPIGTAAVIDNVVMVRTTW